MKLKASAKDVISHTGISPTLSSVQTGEGTGLKTHAILGHGAGGPCKDLSPRPDTLITPLIRTARLPRMSIEKLEPETSKLIDEF
jgi:hypothetical protein